MGAPVKKSAMPVLRTPPQSLPGSIHGDPHRNVLLCAWSLMFRDLYSTQGNHVTWQLSAARRSLIETLNKQTTTTRRVTVEVFDPASTRGTDSATSGLTLHSRGTDKRTENTASIVEMSVGVTT
jgi:hypothetical protein